MNHPDSKENKRKKGLGGGERLIAPSAKKRKGNRTLAKAAPWGKVDPGRHYFRGGANYTGGAKRHPEKSKVGTPPRIVQMPETRKCSTQRISVRNSGH